MLVAQSSALRLGITTRTVMYELKIFLDSEPAEIFESESLPRLTREVALRFNSIDPLNVPLPFDAEVDDRGRIVKMTLDADLQSLWWQRHHPLLQSDATSLIAVIAKKKRGNSIEGFPIPQQINRGNGKAWAAVRDGAVADLVYMKDLPSDEGFEQFRERTRQRLSEAGKLITGIVDGPRLVPNVRRNARDA